MRQSKATFIDECFDLKVHLQVSSYELHDYEDGDYADFHVNNIESVSQLAIITQGYDTRIFVDERGLTIRIFENYCD